MSSFSDLGLSEHLLQTLSSLGYETPTRIQEQAIPLLLGEPEDFIGLAQTGTGKTAAFGLPLLEQMDAEADYIQAIVLAPTRELGQQTAAEIKKFNAAHKRLRVECVYGGANIAPQIKALKGDVHILVATPGRLIDLAKRKALRLDRVRFLVLDEADEMLNMGFREELDEILKFTPEDKVTWLFSATMPPGIRKLTVKYMSEPKEISVAASQRVNADIEHTFAQVRQHEKVEAMRRFIDNEPEMYALAFCRTKAGAQKLASQLAGMGYRADALHGDLSQAQRNHVMRRFKAKQLDLLIATDVAARGIDVDNLTHVFHYDLPQDAAVYTHRSGRTGRAGRTGISLCLVTRGESPKLERMGKTLKIELSTVRIPDVEAIVSRRINHWAKGITASEMESPVPDALVDQAEAALGELSRRDLVHRLLAAELQKMGYDGGADSKDLNQADSGDASKRKHRGNTFRYFINVGEIDGLSRGELVKFICKHSKLPRAAIHQIDLQKQHSFFQVETDDKQIVIKAFRGMNLNGRPLRVNEEAHRGKSIHKKKRGKRPFRPAHDKHRGRKKKKR